MKCVRCFGPDAEQHHVARPTEATIPLCGPCNRLQENREQHAGTFRFGATTLGKLAEQLFSLNASTDPVLIANLVALRSVLAVSSQQRTGAQPISNRCYARDDRDPQDQELLMRKLLGAIAQAIEELGLPNEAALARRLSTCRPSGRLHERGYGLLKSAPQIANVLADEHTNGFDPNIAVVERFFSQARSLLELT